MLTDDATISAALADLAGSTGEQPLPLAPIEARARRMRRGRRAGRAGIVGVCAATLATGIGLAGSGGAKPAEISAFGASPAPLPLCRTLLTQTAPAPAPVASGSSPDAVKRAAAAAAGVAGSEAALKGGAQPAVGEKFKSIGTIVGAPRADAVTILVSGPLTAIAHQVTFTIGPDTQFLHAGQPTDSRILRAGDSAGFVATRTGQSGYRLDAIDAQPDGATSAAAAPSGRAGGRTGLPPVGQAVDGKGFLAAVPASRAATVSVAVIGGPLDGRTVRFSVTPASRFEANGRQCDPSGLPAGTLAGFTATRTGPAAYRLDRVNLA